jgi:8-oxo-dGTP pyrophosphatase MutT (NUDIX family)
MKRRSQIQFVVADSDTHVAVFTDHPEMLYGVTFIALSPQHPLVGKLAPKHPKITHAKPGAFTGKYAINPLSGAKIPIWIANYVPAGEGAIMAVPAHNKHDFAFAKQSGLPITEVVAPEFGIRRDNEKWADGATIIVYDETTDKFLGLDWGDWTGLVGGGINDGETYQECARRELAEEAGIIDTIVFEPLGGPVFAHYQHPIKKLNRVAKTAAFMVVVTDRQGEHPQREAHETFENAWLDINVLTSALQRRQGTDHWLELLRRARKYVEARKAGAVYDALEYRPGEGIVINSDQYNHLSTDEARAKIIADLGL